MAFGAIQHRCVDRNIVFKHSRLSIASLDISHSMIGAPERSSGYLVAVDCCGDASSLA